MEINVLPMSTGALQREKSLREKVDELALHDPIINRTLSYCYTKGIEDETEKLLIMILNLSEAKENTIKAFSHHLALCMQRSNVERK